MTIEEAIHILSDSAHLSVTTHNPDFRDALKLAIQALIEKSQRAYAG